MMISADQPTRSLRPRAGGGRRAAARRRRRGPHDRRGRGHPRGATRALEAYAREHFGATEVDAPVVRPRPHARGRPAVHRPYTPASRQLWTAAGFRKWGMSNATMAAEILGAGDRGATTTSSPRVFDTTARTSRGGPRRGKRLPEDVRHFVGDSAHGRRSGLHALGCKLRVEHWRSAPGTAPATARASSPRASGADRPGDEAPEAPGARG